MVLSMTGYGKAQAEINGKKVSVEIKSLNSKQMDLSTRISSLYRNKENEIRNNVARCLERGKVELSLYAENLHENVTTAINTDLLNAYYQKIMQLSKEMNIAPPENTWEVLLHLPNVLQGENPEVDENEWIAVNKLVDEAISHLIAFRTQEGEMLGKFFLGKIEKIEQLLQAVEPYEKDRTEKIKLRITDALDKSGWKDFDKNRFEQEMIYYLEKLDITEEKTRLANHCKYFRETMNENGKGKKLGFILQEMGREINTLGSKSNQAEMQRLVVGMKDELEQMKEQVLNVL